MPIASQSKGLKWLLTFFVTRIINLNTINPNLKHWHLTLTSNWNLNLVENTVRKSNRVCLLEVFKKLGIAIAGPKLSTYNLVSEHEKCTIKKKQYSQCVTWISNPLHSSTSHFLLDHIYSGMNVANSVLLYVCPKLDTRLRYIFLVFPRRKLHMII